MKRWPIPVLPSIRSVLKSRSKATLCRTYFTAIPLIVATARVANATLMTRDRRILDYAARGHLTAIAV
jgi:hypothetical protein